MVVALADIAWAEASGYGKATNYGGFDTFFTALGAVSAFIQNLFAQNISFTGALNGSQVQIFNDRIVAWSGASATNPAVGDVRLLIDLKNSAGDIILTYCRTAGTWTSISSSSLKLHIDDTFAKISAMWGGLDIGNIYFFSTGEIRITDLVSDRIGTNGAPFSSKSTTSTLDFAVYKPITVALYNNDSEGSAVLKCKYNGTYYQVAGADATPGPLIVSINPGYYQLARMYAGTAYVYLIGSYGGSFSSGIWS